LADSPLTEAKWNNADVQCLTPTTYEHHAGSPSGTRRPGGGDGVGAIEHPEGAERGRNSSMALCVVRLSILWPYIELPQNSVERCASGRTPYPPFWSQGGGNSPPGPFSGFPRTTRGAVGPNVAGRKGATHKPHSGAQAFHFMPPARERGAAMKQCSPQWLADIVFQNNIGPTFSPGNQEVGQNLLGSRVHSPPPPTRGEVGCSQLQLVSRKGKTNFAESQLGGYRKAGQFREGKMTV